MAKWEDIACPFGGESVLAKHREDAANHRDHLRSPAVLGDVLFSGSAWDMVKARTTDDLRGLRRWLVERQQDGGLPEMINSKLVRDHLIHREWPLRERADRLFRWLLERCRDAPLVSVRLDPVTDDTHAALVASDAVSQQELILVSMILHERGWISFSGDLVGAFDPGHYSGQISITSKGWITAEERSVGESSHTAFVAMWFSEETAEAKEGILNAIEAAGYVPRIINSKEYVGPIVDEILSEIRAARFVVVDYTCGSVIDEKGKDQYQVRGGVYWEAGFAMGLGLPVISTIRADLLDAKKNAIHFDVAQYNHINWSEPSELRERVENRIGAVIGWGPHRGVDDSHNA